MVEVVQVHPTKSNTRQGVDADELSKLGRLAILDDIDGADALLTWQQKLQAAMGSLSSKDNIMLILDAPDILLGTASASADSLISLIMDMRHEVKRTIITMASDIFPQGVESNKLTALQVQQQQFLLSIVHQANIVMSTRILDTGHAKDVGGVLMVTRGGRATNGIDAEYLFHIENNRAARVWKRGAER